MGEKVMDLETIDKINAFLESIKGKPSKIEKDETVKLETPIFLKKAQDHIDGVKVVGHE